MKADLTGKIALVTGAARGIGRAIAEMLGENGATVVYSGRDEASVAKLVEPGGRHVALKMDVAREDEVDAAVETIVGRYGRIDILVNNAGVGTPSADRAPIDRFRTEVWDRVIQTDLNGLFYVSRAGARAMVATGTKGRIINIGSVTGLVPLRLQSSYVAAKAAVAALTRSMAMEMAPHGILVNAVAPGSTATDAWEEWIKSASSEALTLNQRLMEHIPLGRPASCEEIATSVLFLAAPANTYMTGHVLVVDGGWTTGYVRDF